MGQEELLMGTATEAAAGMVTVVRVIIVIAVLFLAGKMAMAGRFEVGKAAACIGGTLIAAFADNIAAWLFSG